MPGRLTTHVLDTANGRPAAGMTIELARIGPGDEREVLARVVTNSDGRTDGPLLAGEALQRGTYELTFASGDYWATLGVVTGDPPFLDRIPIRFGIPDPEGHYHVPLLCSPWAYSTYRGS
jgi:5-hydroxyisourate hydrolase